MAVEGVSDFIMSSAVRESPGKQNKDLSMDDFFQLMVAQLKNQDMFSPMDNSQFLNQMAQFSMVNALMGMSELSNMAYTTSLIGKMATVAFLDGGRMIVDEGIIESVNLFNGSAEVVIGGIPYQLGNIMTINDASRPVEGNDKLVDNSGLIGKSARVLHTTPEGGIEELSGRITGVRLVSGKVYVIIDDKAYPLSEVNALHEIAVKTDDEADKKGSADNPGDKTGATVNNPGDKTGAGVNNPGDATGAGVDNPDGTTGAGVDNPDGTTGAGVNSPGDTTGAGVDNPGDTTGTGGGDGNV